MIKKQKKLSSSLLHIAVSVLVLTLIVFFVYSTFFHIAFYTYLTISLLTGLTTLVIIRQNLDRDLAILSFQKQDVREKINLLEAEINKDNESIHSFRKKIINFSYLKNLTEKLCQCLIIQDTSNTLSAEAGQLFGDNDLMTILYLFQSRTGELGLSSSKKGQMRVSLKSKRGDLFDQWVVKTLQPCLVEDVRRDFRFDLDKMPLEDEREIRSLISVPLMSGSKALGLLRVDSPKDYSFNTEDLRLLRTIGDLGAVAIENAQLYERVEDLAIRDGLTKLYLRRHFQERLAQEVSRALRLKKQLSFVMLDLDNFKAYNDKFGHVAGDIVLRTVSMILSNYFNDPGHIICRYGGEEFAVLLSNCSQKDAVKMAEDVRQQVEEQNIMLRREKTHITVSIGVATLPDDARVKDELILKADFALYQAKEKGRNRVVAAKDTKGKKK